MAVNFEIEKFSWSMNFRLWQSRMKAVLTLQGLHKTLTGKEEKSSSLSSEEKKELDEKALAAIQLSLSDEVLREVYHEETAAELWMKLESLYMARALPRKNFLKFRLYSLKMAEGTSIESHLNEFQSRVFDLEDIGEKIEDGELAELLLCSLPSSLDNLWKSFVSNKDSVSTEDVKSLLYSKMAFDEAALVRHRSSGPVGYILHQREKSKEISCTTRNVNSLRI